MMLGMRTGGKNLLIPNPRDLPAVPQGACQAQVHSFPAVNISSIGLANHADFNTVDRSPFQRTPLGGGTVQAVAG
jgi:long-chain acyl-CoA synthetase